MNKKPKWLSLVYPKGGSEVFSTLSGAFVLFLYFNLVQVHAHDNTFSKTGGNASFSAETLAELKDTRRTSMASVLFYDVVTKSEVALQDPVSGTVTADGLPLPGASVVIKGTSKGTQTDFDGKFELDLTNGDVVVVSYVGFAPQEVTYSGQNTLDIVLVEDAAALETVVVTGYSQQSTKNITGSVTVVKSEDLVATAPTNIEQALQGQASGVIVGSQGAPGDGASVRIRGFGTINGNDPLYIIDGTPTVSGLQDLNPNDIASIQVLKDASSAAIYGNRAANGVIIITTKGGKKNTKVQFSGNAYLGIDFIPSSVFPDLASPQQLLEAAMRADQNDGSPFANPQFGSGSNAALPVYLNPQGSQTPGDDPYSLENNRITRANQAGTDWFDEYFDAALTTDYNVSATGGSENASFFMSLNALDQEGVGAYTGFERYTLRANSKFSITDRFRIGENISFSYSDQIVPPGTDVDNGTISSLFRMHPIIPVRDEGGNFAGVGVGSLGNAQNAIATAFNNKDNSIITLRALGNAFLEFDVLEGLTLKTNLGFDITSENRTTFNPRRYEGETVINNNNLEERSALTKIYTWFNTATYRKEFGNHRFDILAGTELNKDNFREFRASRGGFLFDDAINTRYLDLGTDDYTGQGFGDIKSYYSVFGKVDYRFDDRYLLSGTLRYDASSLFNPDSRDGVFPSFSAGWRISNEDFMQDSPVFTNLMLKLGYGVVANNGDIDPNRRVNVYSPNPDFYAYPNSNSSSSSGYGLDSRGNPDLEWETTTTFNIGITSRLFDLVNLDFDYYNATTNDMLLDVPQDPTVFGNINTITKNVGEMNNKGFDLSLSYASNPSSGGFEYNIGFNISGYKNEVVSLGENPDNFINGENVRDQIPNRTLSGMPLASFYGKRLIGVDENGRFEFANDGAQEFIGNPHPDFTYGINFGANYKNFDFSMLIQGSQGNDIYNFMKYFTDFNSFVGAKSIDYVTSNGLPSLTNDAGIIALESEQSSYFVEDGSYARLKNIVLGYSLPQDMIAGLGLDRFRLYLQGKNLITLTNYSGLDPEVNFRNTPDENANLTLGVDSGVYPINRSLIVGLNVSF